VLAEAAMVTVIDDREGRYLRKNGARLPDERTHLFDGAPVRDRCLADGK